ncbi:hypothetical protein [Hyphomonas pacifica]|uniref:Uncharacterized protein n=1 Tax=Hyphomonas pacifica TaxID=1280941 RepID=A0A8B2PFU9_9PROT|nr:hypothetical protein [Hyphomonas pacifica]RAN30624.1 hypothetical protein HY3_05600 [Hyphomonas pacifica]
MQLAVEPIAPGYDARLVLVYPNEFADFHHMEDGYLITQIRADLDAEDVLFEASSESGSIVLERGNAETCLTLSVPATATALMAPDTNVVFDIVRIDGAVRDVIPGLWRWPVRKTVTQNVV